MKLWKNGVIHTLDNNDIKNIVTKAGHIIELNADESKTYEEVIDLKGNHLYPGFVDAHLHLIGYGQFLQRLDLSHIQDKKEALKHLNNSIIQDYLIVDGYHEWVGINKTELNSISKEKPIILRHHDFHAVTVNDQVLTTLKFESESGILREEDAKTVLNHYTKVSNETLEGYLKQAIETLYRFGITGGHSDDLAYFNGYHDTLNVFLNVLKTHPFRTHLLVHHSVLDDHIQSPYFNHRGPFLELKSIKVFYDGTMSSKTALMHDGYQESDSKGWHTTPDFVEILKKVRQNNQTLAVHVIGDQGLDELIDILKKYPPQQNQKDRIIHAPWVSEYGMNMLKTIPVTIDIQPQFLSSDFPEALSIFKRLPPYIFPWKTMLNQGLILSFSSDAPVETPNPLLGILDSTERVAKDNRVYQVEEKISRKEAILGYTLYANAQNHLQNRGQIKLGNVADFSIFKFDLEKASPETLKENIVFMTVIDEHIVYSA